MLGRNDAWLNYLIGGVLLKNYFEHKDKVKYVDGLLANSQDWDWFVKYVEENYDFKDINDWMAFKGSYLQDIFSKCVKIFEVFKGELSVKNKIFAEIINIAKFYLGIITVDECKVFISSNYSKLLFAIVWITKLENKKSAEQYITDFRLFTVRNAWEIIDVSDIKLVKDEIIEYIDTIQIDKFDIYRKCFEDNITEIKYELSEGFMEKYKESMYSVNAFSYQTFERPDMLSWQEEYILNMLRTLIRNGEIIPLMSGYNFKNPDIDIWTVDVINKLKAYFLNDVAYFVLDTVNYIKNGIKPDARILLMHCNLLSDFIDSVEKEYDIVRSSSFEILKWTYRNGDMSILKGNEEYIRFIKKIQTIGSVYIVKALFDANFPISKEQRLQINQFYAEQYKSIEEIENINEILKYLKNEDIPKQITTDYFQIVVSKFNKFIQEDNTLQVSNLFYHYMVFLLNTNGKNVNIRFVKDEMIRVQNIWQEKYYKEQIEKLEVHSFSTTIPNNEIDLFNEMLLRNPILVAEQCMIIDEENLIKVMENTTERALTYMAEKISLSPTFPEINDSINYEHHEIDCEIKKIVEVIKEKNGYRFLNDLSVDTHMFALHERYKQSITTTVSLVKDEKKLYNFLAGCIEYELLPYEDELKLAHLTQFFPILERYIRKLGALLGVVPFKESIKEFSKFKDSSSVLREVILSAKEELGSFENIPDLMFVYNSMYNGNSINVRNDCMHGRDYLQGGRLRFAFRLTMIALHMIIYRINAINKNLKYS